MPFLAILAAGMIAGAATARFEWLYPLRFFVAASALWFYRRSYLTLNWKFDWSAPMIGALTFLIWILLDRIINPHVQDVVPAALTSFTLAAQTWMVLRVLAAVVTVPLAEELAFRGFLLRRLTTEGFESASFRHVTWFAVLTSSAVFGAFHGSQWLAGTIVGVAFAWAAIRRGRIGDAVYAHATANALLAAYVLLYQQWHLW